jgi:hypothetical protein
MMHHLMTFNTAFMLSTPVRYWGALQVASFNANGVTALQVIDRGPVESGFLGTVHQTVEGLCRLPLPS